MYIVGLGWGDLIDIHVMLIIYDKHNIVIKIASFNIILVVVNKTSVSNDNKGEHDHTITEHVYYILWEEIKIECVGDVVCS